MMYRKTLITLIICLFLFSCGSNNSSKKSDFSIKTNAKNKTITLGKTLSPSINNPKNHDISSVSYKLSGKSISENELLDDEKLGKQTLEATIVYNDDKSDTVKQSVTILNNNKPKVFTYKIINEYPHDITSYTQGLEFYNGKLYESTGQYKESKLRIVDYKTGKTEKNINLSDNYFAEGITIIDDKVYQLTWREKIGFVYDANTLEKTSSFKYNHSKEGWGLAHNENYIYQSDGTETIYLLNKETLVVEDKIQAFTNKGKIIGINELELVNGKLYANRYQKDGVAIINPKNGAIEGVIDFSPLKKTVTQHDRLDVLNGIAYNPDTKTLFITGKKWDKLFEVEIIEKQ